MAGNGRKLDLLATVYNAFDIGIGTLVVKLKNVAGVLRIRNKADSADAELVAAKLSASGDDISWNEDATGSGADQRYTLRRPAAGMTGEVVLVLPVDDGSPGDLLSTDGAGNTNWVAAGGSTGHMVKVDETPLAFGSPSTVSMFTNPALGYVDRIEFIVDTAFNGSVPSASIGTAGSTSKYMAANQLDLKTVGQYEVGPGQIPVGTSEALQITYAASSSSAGAARVLVHYSVPT